MVQRNTRREYLAAMGAGAVALGGAQSVAAQSETVVVPDDEPTIQAGVDAVAAGGTVEVRARTYEEQVNIGKPVTILGDPGDDSAGTGPDAPVIDGGGATEAVAFRLHASGRNPDRVTIRGFEMQNFGRRPAAGEWGGGVGAGAGNSDVTVADCYIHDVGASGISVGSFRDETDWTVERNVVEGAPESAIQLGRISGATVRNNVIRGGPVTDDGSWETDRTDTDPDKAIHVHADARNGASTVQENVVIEGNTIEGGFETAGVFLLAINANDPDEFPDSEAVLRGVTVENNTFSGIPRPAVQLAVNPVGGGTTQMRDVSIRGNTVRNGRAGFSVESGAEEGLSGVQVVDNDVEAEKFALEVGGKRPAGVTDVVSRGNEYRSDVFGIRVLIHEREADAGDERYNVDGVRVVGDDVGAGDMWGVGVQSNQPHGVGSVVVKDVTSAGKEGLHASGHAPDALESVRVEGGSFEGLRGSGIHFHGGVDDDVDTDVSFVGSVHLTGATVSAEGPGVAVSGRNGSQNAPGIAQATIENVTVERGRGFGVFGKGPDAVGRVVARNLTSNGSGGMRLVGLSPGAIHEANVDGLDADVAGGPGFAVVGRTFEGIPHDGDRPHVGPVTLSNANLTTTETGVMISGSATDAMASFTGTNLTIDAAGRAGILVHGKSPDAVGTTSFTDVKVDSTTRGVVVSGEAADAIGDVNLQSARVRASVRFSNVIRAEHSNGVESVSLENCDLSESHTGLLVWGTEEDATQSVDIIESDVRNNNYGIIVGGPTKGGNTPQSGDAVTIRQTNVVGNSFRLDNEIRGFGVFNLGQGTVDARHNYWGSAGGPAHPRPGASPITATGDTPEEVLENYPMQAEYAGGGDRVSEGVSYRPWLKQPA